MSRIKTGSDMRICIKRVYDKAAPHEGTRILVDRLWPRGVSKKDAAIAIWLKEIAPSTELRKWFGHDLEKWEEFKKRYFAELDRSEDAVEKLRAVLREKPVTLVYAARDEARNNAAALKLYLEGGHERPVLGQSTP